MSDLINKLGSIPFFFVLCKRVGSIISYTVLLSLSQCVVKYVREVIWTWSFLCQTVFLFVCLFVWLCLWYEEFPGPGIKPTCSCYLCHGCGNARSLTQCIGQRIKSMPLQRQCWIFNPLHHRRNS